MTAPRRRPRPANKWTNKTLRREARRRPAQAGPLDNDYDIRVIADVCRALAELTTCPPRRLSREELTGEMIDAWCRLRNLLLWRLPPDQFAALDL